MSKTVDERVVEMRFDNKHFESNVQTTMSTLDKLKEKLRLSDSAKGLEQVGHAAKSINLTHLGSAAETVGLKFNAMYTIADQALRNITNSAIHAGKRIVSALTIDPIKTGFSEYETKINSIQTIMSNTASKGTTMEDVTRVIDELNTYADKTIYNFSEMTRNIGTFTAAGVGLEESAAAIQGIANLAAASGSNSQQASTAMYQLSQALAAGTVKLMDWNSVVNAGMGGEKFQEALKQTAREMGISVDSIIKKNGSFRDSLQDGWLTADVLNTTLQKFTKEGAKEYAEAMVASGKYTKEQADALMKEAESMEDAATKVKTFTQLWDTLKESAQSGWGKTWELIFGDFEEAKELFSSLSDFLGGFINRMSDFRNNLLEGALSSPFGKLAEKLENITGVTEKMTNATKDYGEIVDRIIAGEFGNGQARWDKLTEMGYDWAHAQNLVNEKLGVSLRRTTDYKEAQDETNKTQAKTIEQLVAMSDAQLKNLGFTEAEIEGLRQLEEQSKKTGIPIEELVKDMDQLSGRSLLINSFKNAGKGLVTVLKALKDAWVEIFPPMTSEQLYNIIAGLHKFSTNLVVSEETADKLKRTLKGVFAIIDIVTTLVGGGFKIAFKVLTNILSYFDMDILDLTAIIGDALVRFRDWIDSILDVSGVIEFVVPYIKKAADTIREWLAVVKDSSVISKIGEYFSKSIGAIKDWISTLKESDNIPRDIILGLANGLKNGVSTVIQAAIEIGKGLIQAIKDVLEIHSPARKTFELGWYAILGFIEGIKAALKYLWDTAKGIGSGLVDIIGKIDFGKILALGLGVGMLGVAKKLLDILEMFGSPLDGISDMIEGLGDMFEGIGKSFKASALKKQSEAVLNFAKALLILVGAIWLLTLIEPGKLWAAIGALAVLVIIIGALAGIAKLLGGSGLSGFSFGASAGGILLIGLALLALAGVLKILSMMDLEDAARGMKVLTSILLALVGVVIAIGVLNKFGGAVGGVGSLLFKMALALLIMVSVIKLASNLDEKEVLKGLAIVGTIMLLFERVIVLSMFAGEHADKAGSMMLKMSIAMLLMVGVVKLAGSLSRTEIANGLAFVAGVGAVFAGVMALSLLAGKNAGKAGSMMLKMSIAMLLMVGVIKLVSMMSDDEIERGLGVVKTLGVLFATLIIVSTSVSKDIGKVGTMLITMSVAMLILTGVIFLIGQMDPETVKQGVTVVSILGVLMAGLIYVTKFAKDVKTGPLITLVVAIGLLSVVVIVLSFIDKESLWNSVGALSALMIALGILITATKFAGDIKIKNIATLVGAIYALTGAVWILSMIDSESTIPNVIALGVLMTILSASLFIVSKAGKNVEKAVGPLYLMVGVVGLLAMILGAMSILEVEASIPNVIALSTLLLVMVGALAIASFVGAKATAAIPALYLMVGVVGLLAMILGAMSILEVEASMSTAASLSMLLLAMSAACAIMSLIPITGAIQGAIGLIAFIGIIGAFLYALGSLPLDNQIIQDGGETLALIGAAIGKFVGSLVGGLISGVAVGVMSGLPEMATLLSAFMVRLQPFIALVKNVDGDALAGAGLLAAIIIALGIAELVAFIPQLLGAESLSVMGEELTKFIVAAMPFLTMAQTIKPEMLEGVQTLADVILTLSKANLMETLSSLLGGESSLETFASQLPMLGEGIVALANTLENGGFDESKVAMVNAAADAIKALALVANEIPNTGGLLGDLVGNNDMGPFAEQFPTVGKGIVGLLKTLEEGGFDASKIPLVEAACTAISKLATVAQEIPNTGGLLGDIVGDNDMGPFADQFPKVGKGIIKLLQVLEEGGFDSSKIPIIEAACTAVSKLATVAQEIPNAGGLLGQLVGNNDLGDFADQFPNVGEGIVGMLDALKEGEVTDADLGLVDIACHAITALASASAMVPNSGGFLAAIVGDNDLASFAEQFPNVGTGIAGFVANLGTFDSGQLATVSSACNAIQVIAALGDTDLDSVVTSLDGFGDGLIDLGDDLSEFASLMDGVSAESITAAGSNLKAVIDIVSVTSAVDTTAINNFSDSLKNLADKGIKSFVEAFSGDTAVSEVEGAIDNTVDAGIEAINETTPKLEAAVVISANSAAKASKDEEVYSNFKSAGKYLVEGFAAGISENAYQAEAKARAMASAAAEAAEDELGIQSPSKVFFKIGNFTGMGFINALTEYADKSYRAGSEMADSAKDGLTNSIRKVYDVLDSGIETQPTIRPVLDLSEVQTGVGTISKLMNMGQTIGVSANVGAISSMMEAQRQNGANSDVVSAIDKLRSDLSNMDHATYNVNGVTYDDGSNITSAVKTLVRAARIERRV